MRIYSPRFSTKQLVEYLCERLQRAATSLPIRLAILFGSYAKDRHTAASDVDLLVVYDDPKREDAYAVIWDALDIPQLQLFLYTCSEYDALKESSSIFAREVEKGVRVFER